VGKIVEIDGIEVVEYEPEEIVPIPAKCTKCGFNYTGKDAIRAPSLECCLCWNCWGKLKPHPDYPPVVDAATRRERELRPQVALL
jgi:hypothetical protein